MAGSGGLRSVWLERPVRGFILDITGVLYNSQEGTDGVAIAGSVQAIQRLYSESRVRFLSNESSSTVAAVRAKLGRLGFRIEAEHIITPAPVAAAYCVSNHLTPHLLVHPGIRSTFDNITNGEPNCVLMGDAEHSFTYKALNDAFRVLMRLDNPLLISLGCGKFYQRTDGPSLDVGAFAEGLKFATGCRHIVIGKPREEYFQAALDSLGLHKDEVVMIGDDIFSDVGGALECGIRAVQVRTGKWRASWEDHPTVRPSLIADNLLQAVDSILGPSPPLGNGNGT